MTPFRRQCSMDETQEAIKNIAAAAGGNQEAKDDEVSRNEMTLNSTQMSKTSDVKELEDKLQCKSFLQINDAFEGIRKPWLKLLSLLEYQQEQYVGRSSLTLLTFLFASKICV